LNLLSLNVHWVADAGAALVALSMGSVADGIPEAVVDIAGPTWGRHLLAGVKLLGAVGLILTYLGKPRTVKPA